MAKSSVLITGANGEIGRSLVQSLARDGRHDIVTLDLTPPVESMRPMCTATYAGNIMDRYLLDQIAAYHEFDSVYHLAALLSTRGERDPELAHQVNVEGTLHLLRMAQNQSARLGRRVRFLFPSSIAVYGIASLAEKKKSGRVSEEQHLMPTTMYGCNKLYCEHLGRYFAHHYRQLAEDFIPSKASVDFRSIRFPGLISAFTLPSGGTSDYLPEMLHAAAQNTPYDCFVREDTRIPFMAMPDAIDALLRLMDAPAEKLSTHVYNIAAFAPSAREFADLVRTAFPSSDVKFVPDVRRQAIVDSWPEDCDDKAAQRDWGFKATYDLERAFNDYLLPNVKERYAAK